MWLISNSTPYAAERTWVQDKDSNKLWLVVVKATFDILQNGTCRLAAEQESVLRLGQPYGEFGISSLEYEGDLHGVKPCTDVLLKGKAWAPGGRPISVVDVQMTVGPIKKRLRVFGDRYWERTMVGSVVSSKPQDFEMLPIIYERAFGGWDRASSDAQDHRFDQRNPVGTGFAIRSENCIGKLLPNVEYPNQLIESWKDRPLPASFNAVDCAWTPRRELAGTYDQRWMVERFPMWAEDYNPLYNNCAPADQQVPGYLQGGEVVDLINLSANGRLTFRLPRIYPIFRTRFGIERVRHPAQLCTVIIEPESPKLTMVWQTALVCNHRMDQLDETEITEASFAVRNEHE